jgi:hypothetical protein
LLHNLRAVTAGKVTTPSPLHRPLPVAHTHTRTRAHTHTHTHAHTHVSITAHRSALSLACPPANHPAPLHAHSPDSTGTLHAYGRPPPPSVKRNPTRIPAGPTIGTQA